MKRTELEKKERELRKQQKKISKIENLRREDGDFTISGSINRLFACFQFDEDEIYNINASDELLECAMELQEHFETKELDNIYRKAIKKTKVSEKQSAFDSLKKLTE